MLKQFVADTAKRLGYTILPNWQLPILASLEELRRRFSAFDISLVLDVGANAGQFYDLVRQGAKYGGDVVSFEPIPDLAERLAKRAASDPRWTVRQQALGSQPGRADFNIMVSDQFSSLLAPKHDEVSLFKTTNIVQTTTQVDVVTLDAVLAEHAQHHGRIFLKLDTQGFDLEILHGGQALLNQVAAIQTEASVRQIYEDAPHFTDVITYMERNGFLLSAVVTSNEGHFPLLVDFDLHFVRADLAAAAATHG